jgi:hypothetical protein
MIFEAENINGEYHIAEIDVDDGEGGVTTNTWTVPETQTIPWATDGGQTIFLWGSVPKDQTERFVTCKEFRGLNKAHMVVLDKQHGRNTTEKCIKVFYGDGESCSLFDYIQSGKDLSLVTTAPDLADYYKAPTK